MKDQLHSTFQIGNKIIPHFSYQEFGVCGLGIKKNPIISMDQYIDNSMDTEIHIECCQGLALSSEYKMGMIYGDIPPEEEIKYKGNGSWTKVLKNLDYIDPTGIHHKALLEVIERSPKGMEMQSIYKYVYFALGSAIPWFFALYLKHSDFDKKTVENNNWTAASEHFPKLLKYIKTLPFKEVGRVLFFTTYPNAGVTIHRDSIVAEHKDHNINLFFDGGWRPSFVWDEKKKEKHYLPIGSKSYFFNNRDYHGVDPEPTFRYTVRIDGTFTDELCDKLGLIDGYTWKWSYEDTGNNL
jgi:hypothetical protein